MSSIKSIKSMRIYVLIGITILVTLLCQAFVLTNKLVDGPSMKPNYISGKYVLVSKLSTVRHESVIVFKAPDKANEHYIKRVVGVPGDQVEMNDDQLYVNHHLVPEPYLKKSRYQWYQERLDEVSFTNDFGPITLKKDEYYVLGDNRPISNDSRSFGPISGTTIEGVVKWQY
ncbi:signal peptidase I [Latilactobacillus sp. 5-91]|uniref:signal peptidase I n=1 Tax=Latilactobacillus sp. 5-91 TaxID=3410924 RepID=UPI003C75A758